MVQLEASARVTRNAPAQNSPFVPFVGSNRVRFKERPVETVYTVVLRESRLAYSDGLLQCAGCGYIRIRSKANVPSILIDGANAKGAAFNG